MEKDNHQTWHEYYRKRLAQTSVHQEIERKRNTRADTIEAVINNSSNRKKILEAGCGTSTLSIILNRLGYENYCIDNDQGMIEIAQKFNKEAGTNVRYYLGSVFDLPFELGTFDTVFSHGVLEHFDGRHIVRAINEGLRVAETYIVSFPTVIGKGHPALYGDENLWSYFRWREIINGSDGYIDQAYSMFPKHSVKGHLNRVFRKKLYVISSELGFVIKKR